MARHMCPINASNDHNNTLKKHNSKDLAPEMHMHAPKVLDDQFAIEINSGVHSS